jgi:head-tail adaptor
MRILGQTQTVTGERKRNTIPGWQKVRGVWTNLRDRRAKEIAAPLSAGAFTQETALAIAQRNFVSAQSVELGICDVPTSASFPDGKVHSGMDKL